MPALDRSSARSPTPERVILLHGLWMRRPAMWLLARRLRRAGYEVRLFPYATLRATPQASCARLAAVMRDAGPGPVHLVGHSLGGVTALAMLAQTSGLPPGRVVCLGAPIAGSRAAASLRAPGLAWLIGRSLPLLREGVRLPPDREVGSIAGTLGMGGGRWIAALERPHDGTVAVAETRLPGLADHCCVATSHSGLLVAAEAARQCLAFLREGRFDSGS